MATRRMTRRAYLDWEWNYKSLLAMIVAVALTTSAAAAEAPVFEDDVLPIFTRYCFNCHGKSSPQLGLDLRSARLTMRGSQNGPVIVKGSLEESLLWKKVSTREMPLELFKLKLADAEIETIRRWIEAGAPSNEPTELPADVQQQLARFDNEIQPILTERCVSCHGADDAEAELDLSSLESLVRGSESGPVIAEGFSEKSILIRKVSSRLMPPPDSGGPLTTDEIHAITRWIDKGRFADFVDVTPRRKPTDVSLSATTTEKDRQFWAFQKPSVSPLPDVRATNRVRTPVDRFILAKLESEGLTFSPEASKRILLRRAYFDLIGLPPTPAQARDFLEDESSNAYERLIDRLLASPQYGERWGRYWLDAVGYVDTAGKDHDPATATLSDGYWRYRDYVIAATNKDTPWDRFLVEQIAGDELVDWRNAKTYTPEILELLTATGYLRNVLDATNEDISNLPFDRYEALFMLMDRVSTSTLGMTLACARCHSHKFDPIPQTDYYRFLSVFTSAYNPSDWLPPKERHLFDVSTTEQAEIESHKAKSGQLKQQLASLLKPYKDALRAKKLEQVPEVDRATAKLAVETDEKKRNDAQKKLAAKYSEMLAVTDAEVEAAYSEQDRKIRDALRAQLRTSEQYLATHPINKVQALWDVGELPTIRLLHRGDVDFAGPPVEPGFLSILSPPGKSAAIPSANAVGETSGLRLAFAEWLTNAEHPLTARVIVNRLWQHHFGSGIVDTPGNFGATGSRPTHPELLDWLAVAFVREGWSAKRLHRTIMTSTAYRQNSIVDFESRIAESEAADPRSIDPENRLLWRMNLRRLDAEALRDSVVAVSGQGDYAIGGPPVMLKATATGLQTVVGKDGGRRSVYLTARRSNPATFMRLFDYPTIDVNCTRRSASATPLQSLTMINSEFLTTSANRLAQRVESLVGNDAPLPRKIEAAYQLTLARNPTDTEVKAAEAYLRHLKQLYETDMESRENKLPVLEVAAGRKRSGFATPDGSRPAAKSVTNSRASLKSEQVDGARQSFQNFAHMLLCTNEFLYID